MSAAIKVFFLNCAWAGRRPFYWSQGQSKPRERNFDTVYSSGLCPEDSFDEALADMIHDATDDLRNAVIKVFFEKDEAKKVTDPKIY